MADTYKLQIVTPEGSALDTQVTSVTLPGFDGEIGVLPQHTKYTGLQGVGVLRYTESASGKPVSLVVSGGFCSFSNDTLTILADAVDFPDSVDRDAVMRERPELEKVLLEHDTNSAEWVRARSKLSRVEALQSLFTH